MHEFKVLHPHRTHSSYPSYWVSYWLIWFNWLGLLPENTEEMAFVYAYAPTPVTTTANRLVYWFPDFGSCSYYPLVELGDSVVEPEAMKLLRWKFRLFPLLVFLVSRTRFLSRLIGISSLCRCVCRLRFTVPLTAPISKGAYVTGLADLTADRLSFSYRSQTNAFFILLYASMESILVLVYLMLTKSKCSALMHSNHWLAST